MAFLHTRTCSAHFSAHFGAQPVTARTATEGCTPRRHQPHLRISACSLARAKKLPPCVPALSATGLPTAYQKPSGSGHLALSEATSRRSRTTSALDAASNDRAAARVARVARQSASAIADASRMAFSFVCAALSLLRLADERASDSTVRSIWTASWSCAVMHAPSLDCPSCSADTVPQRDSPGDRSDANVGLRGGDR
jgi:hypothetical protein